jgi:hypothetical protein
MSEQLPDDLQALLAEAKEKVSQTGRIWATRSITYKSQLRLLQGLVLGGTLSPHFTAKRQPADGAIVDSAWTIVAAGASLSSTRLIYLDEVPDASESVTLQEWVPFLESLAKANEGLCVVSPKFSNRTLLATLIVNNARGRLQCVVVEPGNLSQTVAAKLHPKPGPRIEAFFNKGAPAKISEIQRESLMVFDPIWFRDSAVAIPSPGEKDESGEFFQTCAVIEVGGRSLEDQNIRFQLLSQTITDW